MNGKLAVLLTHWHERNRRYGTRRLGYLAAEESSAARAFRRSEALALEPADRDIALDVLDHWRPLR
jgi:hypothetical protein